MSKRILLISLITISLFTITGCKDKDNSNKKEEKQINIADYAGTYEGVYTRFLNDPNSEKKRETFSLILNADGTGIHNHNDSSFNITWSYDGETFQMTEKYFNNEIEYSGTLKKDKITIYNGDKDSLFTIEYVYLKE